MQTDERPPPEPWYKKLVPASLKSAWRVIDAGMEQTDPWGHRTLKEQLRISWGAMTGKIPDEEATRLCDEAGRRRQVLVQQLRGHPSADDGPANP